ncbi:MAG TPA: hypothetical protein VGN20_12520 [Mucilaginibacter sp.]|jgi:opacity protein-like surface antigen
MKKFSIVILVFIFAVNSQLKAQTISANVFGGYTFQDKLNFGNAYALVKGGFMWGVSAEGIGPQGQALELLYQYQSTTFPVYNYSGGGTPIVNPLSSSDHSGVVSYLLINGIQYFHVNPKIVPYFGAGGGVGFVSVNSGNGSSTGFAWDLKTGVKIKTSSSVGFKIGAQLMSVLSQSGGYYYYPYSYTSFASIWQFSFTGGVTFDFGGK